MAHTPGPWEVDRTDPWKPVITARDGEDFIAELGSNGQSLREITDNAELMKSAPQLLEALKAALELLDGLSLNTKYSDSAALARAAIAAAEGK